MDHAEVAAIMAKATAIVAVVIAGTTTLLGQISDSAATASGAAVLAGLTVSAFALIRFLIARSTTDEGRSTEMWTDLRDERDTARERAAHSYKKLESVRTEMAVERSQRIHWQNVATQVRTEFRLRLGEEPSSWEDLK